MLKIKILRSCLFFAIGETITIDRLYVYFTQESIDCFEKDGFIELLNKEKYKTINEAIEVIAHNCYERIRAFSFSIGEKNVFSWNFAEEWQKNSVRNGVKFHLINPYATPEDSHNNWMTEKERTGWKYGPIKDQEQKEHPCMVPYDQLPKDQQTKDALFISAVRSFE